jgi:hypothetical protein
MVIDEDVDRDGIVSMKWRMRKALVIVKLKVIWKKT